MLESLSIRNYVLIDKLDLEFGDGFSAITGETGSGKSILLGALSLILGAKADKESIRKGEDSTEVAAVFLSSSPAVTSWLDAHDAIGDDGEIIIRRSIRMSGRSSYTVNGIPVSRKEGEELGSLLVDISSQHSNQWLLKNDVLRAILDKFSSLDGKLSEYKASYRAMRELEKEISELEIRVRKSREEEDFMRYSLKELENADLKEGEEDELKREVSIISSSEYLKESLSSALSEVRSLEEALSAIRKSSEKDDRLIAERDRTESIQIEAEDIALSLRGYLESIDFSEVELEEKNSRLMTLQRIRHRYGGSIEEAIRRRDEYREKLEESENSEDILLSLKKKHDAAAEKARKMS